MMLESWKIKREAWRLFLKVRQLPWLLFSDTLRQWYDRHLASGIKRTIGQLQPTSNFAIFLIFQPNGLPRSIFHTLDHLLEEGFAPIIVSNCPLAGETRDRLRSLCYLIMERPNYGYDFGGYRDGILHLLQQGIYPDNLLILNDSVWFPLKDECEFLQEVITQDSDLYGLVMTDRDPDPRLHHIQSYLFNFKRRVVASPEFAAYWRNLFLSNNKVAVVRQCEMKMTQYFKDCGFKAGAKFCMQDIYDILPTLPEHHFKEIVTYQMIVDKRRSRRLRKALIETDAIEREPLLRERGLGRYFLTAHPLLLEALGCPALKKDRQFNYSVQRKTLLEQKMELTFSPVIQEEIRQRDRMLG